MIAGKGFKKTKREDYKKKIFIFGGGNHAQYCIDIIEREGRYEIAGIIDSIAEIGSEVYGYRVVGRQQQIAELAQSYNVQHGIITVGDNWIRNIIHNDILKHLPSFEFVNALHPSIIIGNNVKIGKGIIAMAGTIFNPGATIGNFTFFATGAQIEHDCVIGDFASVSAGSVLGGHVHIEPYAAITLGVTIMDRVSIGFNSVVGSGSLVTKDIPKNVLAYGSPAKIIRTREEGERFLK